MLWAADRLTAGLGVGSENPPRIWALLKADGFALSHINTQPFHGMEMPSTVPQAGTQPGGRRRYPDRGWCRLQEQAEKPLVAGMRLFPGDAL